MSLTHITFSVLFALCLGFFASMGVLSAKKVGRRYYLYHGLGTSVLSLIAYLILRSPDTQLSLYLWGFILFSSLFSLTVGGERKRLAWVSYATASLMGLLAFERDLRLAERVTSLLPSWFLGTNTLLATGVLGFTFGAMILGHWYLIEPKLPIEQLKRLTLIMIAVLGLRSLLCLVGSFEILSGMTEIEVYRYLGQSTAGIFLLMRWVWGILGPLFLCAFIWQTVKMRSTQSATGILYVATVLVLAGETVSFYLMNFHGIPL